MRPVPDRIHQHETTRAVSVLGFPWRKARLTKKRGLLVTKDARNRYPGEIPRCVPIYLGRGADRW